MQSSTLHVHNAPELFQRLKGKGRKQGPGSAGDVVEQYPATRYQAALKSKERELEAIRGGAAAESSLASSTLREAQQGAQRAQQAAQQAEDRARAAEQKAQREVLRARAEAEAAEAR